MASGQVDIPATAPVVLAGQPANPGGVRSDSEWQAYGKAIASASNVSFISFYGTFPPANEANTQSFLVDASEPIGGTGDQAQLASGLAKRFQQLSAQANGSFAQLPLTSSILGGRIACYGYTAAERSVGQCQWSSSTTFIEVTTFTGDISAIRSLTLQIVNELHS